MVKSVHLWCDGSPDQSFMVVILSYFLLQQVLHNKGGGLLDDAYKRTLAANWKE